MLRLLDAIGTAVDLQRLIRAGADDFDYVGRVCLTGLGGDGRWRSEGGDAAAPGP
jgi:hypothetical protein